MKWSLIALATLSVAAGSASAQSSVTLSGAVDAGIRRVGTASGSDWQLGGSGSTNNKFILSGREDLGGGMSAIFSLQHRFNIQNGTIGGTSFSQPANANVFWRESWVGLAGGFGDVRLGRILMPLHDIAGGFEPWGVTTVGSVYLGGINATIRGNNVIYYRSPAIGGLSVHAAIAAAEGQLNAESGGFPITGAITPTALVNRERPIGFNVRYASGPINVGMAYDRNSADMKTTGLYGSYNFGAFRLMGQFEKGDNYTTAAGTTKEDVKGLSLGIAAPLGPVEVRAGYARINSNLAMRDGSKLGFGGVYNLSKRTNLYATLGKSSGDRYTAAQKKAAFDLGVTHRF